MNSKFIELKERLEKLEVNSKEDQEKVSIIKDLFTNEHCFFDLDEVVALNILSFWGIEKNKILDYYFDLISPANYQKIPKTMTIIEK